MSKMYSSNFTLEQWELIEPFISPPTSRDRHPRLRCGMSWMQSFTC